MKASEFKALIKEEVRKVLNEALAPADRSKLTNKVVITVAIARTLMNNAKTGKLKHMSAPGGITHYWNPKTKEYVGRTEQEGRLNQGTFFFSDALDKTGNLTESYVTEGINTQEKEYFVTYYIAKGNDDLDYNEKVKAISEKDAIDKVKKDAPRLARAFSADLVESINESAMSDVDLMAKDASTFNQFAMEFFKEYPNIKQDEKMGFVKWLKTVYTDAKNNK